VSCKRIVLTTKLLLTEFLSIARFASRFLLNYFVGGPSDISGLDFVRGRIDLIRRVIFSRTLRLLPLPQQVGAVEGLATMFKLFPSLFPLTDQHVLTFLSELLKMASVADGEMTDKKLNDIIVDKDGFVPSESDIDRAHPAKQSSSLFYRRQCVFLLDRVKIVIPGELPTGVQFRVSSIMLLHSIINYYSDAFFDADSTTPIGTFFETLHHHISITKLIFSFVFDRKYSAPCNKSAFPIPCFTTIESCKCSSFCPP
jgi:hypothetical protein